MEGVKSHYIGETHRTIWDRMGEHFNLLEKCSKESTLYKHWMSHHEEMRTAPKFSVKRLGTYLSGLERQIREALAIQAGEYDNLLNSKSEWAMNAIPRQRVVYKDVLWEQDPAKEENGARNRPPDDNDPPDESKRMLEPSEFENQYTQRKKRRRIQTRTAAEERHENPDRTDRKVALSRQISRQIHVRDQKNGSRQHRVREGTQNGDPSKRQSNR